MAKLSKAKREALRFGTPERLADMLIMVPPREWMLPDGIPPYRRDQFLGFADFLQSRIAHACVVVADNVGEFYYTTPKNRFDYNSDFPTPTPPFSGMFVEMKRPSRIVCGEATYEWPAHYPVRYGCLVLSGTLDQMPSPTMFGLDTFMRAAREAGDPHRLVMMVGSTTFGNGRPHFDCIGQWLALDASGSILCSPWPIVPPRDDADSLGLALDQWFPLLQSVTLTLSFMNCRNVALEAVEPDRAINRERTKHGKRPFVRYHTINIEPMKRVLRTEGQVETNGLKRALHICRGHFSTYTPERPLFGKVAGTFWVPAHVRGSAKDGVIVSDYTVNAPH